MFLRFPLDSKRWRFELKVFSFKLANVLLETGNLLGESVELTKERSSEVGVLVHYCTRDLYNYIVI